MSKTDLNGMVFSNTFVVKADHDGPQSWWIVQCKNCGRQTKRGTYYAKMDRSCGRCYNFPAGRSGMFCLYRMYRCDAARRPNRRVFTLTTEEFQEITSNPCFYCGAPPSRISRAGNHDRRYDKTRTWGDYLYNGVDRKNNNIGYVPGNCIPCCKKCNNAKHAMQFDEFIEYIDRIAAFRSPIWAAPDPVAAARAIIGELGA